MYLYETQAKETDWREPNFPCETQTAAQWNQAQSLFIESKSFALNMASAQIDNTLFLLSFIRCGVIAWQRVILMANCLHFICWQSISFRLSQGSHTHTTAVASVLFIIISSSGSSGGYTNVCARMFEWVGVLAAAAQLDRPTTGWLDQCCSELWAYLRSAAGCQTDRSQASELLYSLVKSNGNKSSNAVWVGT